MNRGYPQPENLRPDESLPDRFARIVQLHRSRQALASEGWNPTYGELGAAVDQLADSLLACGGQAGDRIALLMRHDAQQIAAMLAVLKAGRIVVVLNPTDPSARLRLVVEDAAPALILTDPENAALASEVSRDFCASVSYVDLGCSQTSEPKRAIDPEATSFIVYTSGSSGRPKGVMMNHRQVMHNALRLSGAMELHAQSRVALLPSLSGLHGVSNAWCALLHGASLHPFPIMDHGTRGLAEWMIDHSITAFSASTSLFRSYMKSLTDGDHIEPVRMVRIGGEVATSDDFKAFREHFHKDCILLNTLASSEAGNITSMRYATSDEVSEGTLAVGRAFKGIEIAITDEHGRLVTAGEAGQIVVKSPYISQGYWRNERLTAERYSRDRRGVPLLKSGDWGRINVHGILEFVGRKDTRVKIHGSSVELDEVEQALCHAPGVNKAVVCPWEGPNGTQLAAYLVLHPGRTSSSLQLRRAARALLPEHMVPSIFIIVDDLPLTPHGKVDRQKLLETNPPKAQQRSAGAFQSEMEAVLAAIWAEAFDLPSVGREDNFIDLGGDSLIASVIAARLYGETGAELNLDMFTAHPTVATMAIIADRMRQTKLDDFRIRSVSREHPLPLSFTQERIWNYSQTHQGVADYTLARRSRIVGALDVDILRHCLNYLARRHELLRTTFTITDGRPVQAAHPPREVDLTLVDLTRAQDPATEATKLAKRQKKELLDLRNGPLVRFTLIKISEDEHWLLRVIHHILYDAWSWKLYWQEFAQLYEAFVRGADPPLPEFEPLQYADYACWQRQFFRVEAQSCQNMISWWKRALGDQPRNYPLPLKRGTPATTIDPREGIVISTIPSDASLRLTEIARQQKATPFQVGLAIFVALLAAKTGRPDIIVGTYFSNRKRPELLRMFGDFSNLVTLRFYCDLTKTFRSWVAAVRDSVTEIAAYSELPYEELRRSFNQDGKFLPEIYAIFQLSPSFPPIRFAGLELTIEKVEIREMPWGFNLSQDERSFEGKFAFDANTYAPEKVRAMIGQWSRFTETVAVDPDLPLTESLCRCSIDAAGSTAGV